MRFSIVIPTHQRRDLVLRTVCALERQTHREFDVIVVDDGSTDGTDVALRSLSVSFPLAVLRQVNQGAAQARNVGAAAATGGVLLFLDDDMEAEPALLREHERSLHEGAHLVLGDLPLHPCSSCNVLSRAVGSWARSRRERLVACGGDIPPEDMISGQMSISRELFARLGGFDGSFTRGGTFGGEDVDFGYRVKQAGCRVVFNPRAISYQYYAVDAADFLRRAYEAGRAEQALILKHPELAGRLGGPHLHRRLSRWLLGPFILGPPALSRPLREAVATLVRTGRGGSRLRAILVDVRTVEYRRGSREAQRALSTGSAVVLAYHAVSDLGGDPVLGEYGVPSRRLGEQLDALIQRGWTFVDLDAILRALRGQQRLPRRSMLMTFDDGYADLLEEGVPVLAGRGLPAIVFAVSDRVGATNDWDQAIGSSPRRLLDANGLRAVAAHQIELGSHGATHRRLTEVTAEEMAAELEGSASQLEALGLPRPRALSYPHGSWDAQVAAAVRAAGYEVAFTVRPGVVARGSDKFALPRIEVLASDTRWRLRIKVATAGWSDRRRALALRLLRIRP